MHSSIWALSVLSVIFSVTATNITGFEKTVHWEPCPNVPISSFCANLSLPVDWNQPDGEHFDLFISKIPAKNQEAKIGNLFYNSGGPGQAPSLGFQHYVQFLNLWTHNPLLDVFDFIAPDPRGTGNSRPILCDAKLWRREIRFDPQTEEEFNRFTSQLEENVQSCYDKTGDWLRYVDTASAAKDFEALRIALGDEAITYLGFSYGTQLGIQYAELFPENIRAMVLDGVFDHSVSDLVEVWKQGSQDYEVAASDFFEWCKGAGLSCMLSSEEDIPAWFDSLVARLDEQPIEFVSQEPCDDSPLACGNRILGATVKDNFVDLLAFPNAGPTWQEVAFDLRLLDLGKPSSAFAQPLEHEGDAAEYFSFVAIVCADASPDLKPPDYTTYRAWLDYARSHFPHTRGDPNNWRRLAICPLWPVPPTNPPHEITVFRDGTSPQLTTPILLVNAYSDPLTGYAGAVEVQRQLGDANSVLLSRDGFGHTSEPFPGAVSDAIHDYLIDLKVPAHGTVLRGEGL